VDLKDGQEMKRKLRSITVKKHLGCCPAVRAAKMFIFGEYSLFIFWENSVSHSSNTVGFAQKGTDVKHRSPQIL